MNKMPRINVYNVTHTPNRPKPYRLKWVIDQRHKSRSFKTKTEAEKFKVKLESAVEDGFLFDPNSGLPEQWVRQFKSYAEVASEYSAVKWGEWSASSRQSFCDGASVVVYELIRPKFKSKYPRLEMLKVIRELILNKNSLKATDRQLEIKDYILENSYRLKEITPEIVTITIQAISKKMNGEIGSTDTQRKRKQTFGAVMDFAFRQNYIKENSFKRVKVKPTQTLKALDPVKALNPQECRAYCAILRNLAKIKKGYYMESADFLEIIWLAGLRPSEVAGLQAKHIHLFTDKRTSYIKVEQAVVSIAKGYTDDLSSQERKGLKARSKNSFRTVPILDELKPTLERLIEGLEKDDYLFTSPKRKGEPIKTDLINDYFREVCHSVHTPYDLRHTHASILIYSGLNVIEVANRLGNSIEVCQKVYLHMINRVEEISTARENSFLDSSKDAFETLNIKYLIGTHFPERD
jgi:integrase